MARFEIAYARTGGHEGHYSNVAADRGGETWAGIARKFWPDWGGWPAIDAAKARGLKGKDLERVLLADQGLASLVQDFYLREFWAKHSLELVPQEIADKIFDMAVNCGVKVAGFVVQRMLNFGNRDQRDYPDLKVDGHMGTKETIPALLKLIKLRGLRLVAGALVCEHYVTYRSIVEKDPEQELFWWGWLRRNLSYLS
jgi:lysozyme family protein